MVSDLLGIAVSKEKFKRAAKLRDAKDWILRERCVYLFRVQRGVSKYFDMREGRRREDFFFSARDPLKVKSYLLFCTIYPSKDSKHLTIYSSM